MTDDDKSRETVGGYEIDPESVKLLPQLFCFSSSVVVLGRVDPASREPVTVGMAEPSNLATLDTVERRFAPRRVSAVRLEKTEIARVLNIAYGISVPSTDVDPNLQGTVMPQGDFGDGDIVHAASNEAAAMRPLGMDDIEAVPHADSEINESRIVGIVNQLLLDALRRGATDIHIENERRQVAVRYKLDGLLYKMKTPLHKDNVDEVINRLKVMATLDISERRSPQDGRVLLRTLRGGRDYDVPFRISILPGPYGEEIVLRVLDKSMAPISLELLGFTSHDLKLYRRLIQNPQGMILVTGPTGSGKTTTLYATLKEINSPYNKILSAEDPIEYNIEGVNQKQISEKFDFADMARAFLRHDPDILLIGEIRDEDTADVACKAAQTGHLILSTVHTNDSVSTISRLNVLGLNHELIGSSLLGVLSQRLVRRICPKCTEAYEPDAEALETFGEFAPTGPFQHGAGCDYCSRTGYRGRIGIFELLIVDDEIQRMISEHAPLDAILEISLAKGMTPLVYDGLRKVEMGYTTLEELNRVVPYRQIAMQLKRKAKYLTDEPKKEATEIVEGGIGAVADIILPPGDATN